MSFLSYKIVRGTCLRFPEQLEVVVTGDVLQQRLPACSVTLTVILAGGRKLKNFQNIMWKRGVCEGHIHFSATYHVLFLLLLIEASVPLPPQLRHLLLVAQLTLCRGLRPQRHKHSHEEDSALSFSPLYLLRSDNDHKKTDHYLEFKCKNLKKKITT